MRITEVINPDIVKSTFYAEKTVEIPDVGPLTFTAYNISTRQPPQFTVDVTNAQGKKIAYFRFIVKDYEPEKKIFGFKLANKTNPYIIGGNVSVWDQYQRKGIARQVYQWIKSMGNDIRPSTTQTSAGKAMWKGFEKTPLSTQTN